MKCKKCQTEFVKKTYNQLFCSKQCQNGFGQSLFCEKNTKRCPRCSGGMYFRSTICESCLIAKKREIIENMTLEQLQSKNSVKNKHKSWINAEVRNFCRSWNKHLLKNSCQNCGYKRHKEFCHIKPISQFSISTKIKDINRESNLLILCPNCHWEFDNNLLSLSDIKSKSKLRHSGLEPDFSTPSTAKNLEDSPG